MKRLLLILFILSITLPMLAQEAELTPTAVEVTAADGFVLKGSYYTPVEIGEEGAPALLLMHMYSGNRREWEPLLPSLLDAGYIVVSVDLRGHGESRGSRDWEAAVTDVQTWLDWLREQDGVRGESIAILGGSIGSNLALVGCANDSGCVTAVALSPGLDYFGVQPETALVEGLAERSALIMAAQLDRESITGVRELFAKATGDIQVRVFSGGVHGTRLLTNNKTKDETIGLILMWLDAKLNIP